MARSIAVLLWVLTSTFTLASCPGDVADDDSGSADGDDDTGPTGQDSTITVTAPPCDLPLVIGE